MSGCRLTGMVAADFWLLESWMNKKGSIVDLQREGGIARSLVDAMDCGLTIQDKDYNIIYQNKHLSKIFEGVGKKCHKIYEGRDKVCPECPVKLAFADGKSHSATRRLRMPDGSEAWWENTANLIRGADGEILCCLEVARNVTERRKAEEKLRSQRKALEEKNIALKEMLSQIETEKNRIARDVALNIDELIMPLVGRLKGKGESKTCVDLLRKNLKNISSSFGRRVSQLSARLTPRELELCSMIRSGLASKEIAGMLNTSHLTIEKQRKSIRKKLKLAHKDVNLALFLQKL